MSLRAACGPVAAIDCGTNSTRLLVVDQSRGALERLMRITRLGEGVDATHRISREAMSRTLSVLGEYRERMEDLGVTSARLAATSAARDASNSEEFLDAAESITGVQPELLSGLEEASLSFSGATAGLPERWRGPGPVLVVDIGGGSTELVAGSLEEPVSVLPTAVSLELGCVRVTERFLLHDPPLPEEVRQARSYALSTLRSSESVLPPLVPEGPLIGLAGTVSTLAALETGRNPDAREVHHTVLTREAVARWFEILVGEPSSSRAGRVGMAKGREDVIAGGALVLDAVMEVFEKQACVVSEEDILDGLAASLLVRARP